MSLKRVFQQSLDFLCTVKRLPKSIEAQMLLQGRLLSEINRNKQNISSLSEVEFKVFSQFGDDGIIQWLVHHLDLPNQTFIEFGVSDYYESNTRFLLMNNNWAGFVMDGSEANINRIRRSDYFWKYSLMARTVFITQENINSILEVSPFDAEIGLLHIDLDGVDYWIWNALETVSPVILILEYNSVFGRDRAITVPYSMDFNRTKAHYSNLYWGASLLALHELSLNKGYAFVGCNSAGNNAYFVRRDKLNSVVKERTLHDGFVDSTYRESRDSQGYLTYLRGKERLELIQGLPVYNVYTGQVENL